MTVLPQAILLMGPTASGKTGLALELARHFPVEIISVDSALVYRGMDIGTAKPSRDELAQVPHHLIDIISPLEAYSAAQFHADANRLIDDIAARGKMPLLVGGTMLYFKALIDGLSDMPPADAATRAQLDLEAAEHGWPALHARLAEVDPLTAARLKPMDSQRIQRALEVFRLTGKPLSAWHAEGREQAARYPMLKLALIPHDRGWLHERIALRFRLMLEQNFLDEVVRLRQHYPQLTPDLPSMRCVGYRQAWDYLDGHCTEAEFIDKGIAATRQLAKRQLTWLRSMNGVTALEPAGADVTAQALSACHDFLSASTPHST